MVKPTWTSENILENATRGGSCVPRDSLAHLLAPIFDRQSASKAKKIGSGLPAGPGAASGHVVFSAEEAVARSEKGEKVVLARVETSPEDLRGMIAAEGILTSRGKGGDSSDAACHATDGQGLRLRCIRDSHLFL